MSFPKQMSAERRAPVAGGRSLRNPVQCPGCRSRFDEQAWGSLRLAEDRSRAGRDASPQLASYRMHRGPKLRLLREAHFRQASKHDAVRRRAVGARFLDVVVSASGMRGRESPERTTARR
jgi:hypothetical protein